MTAKTSKRSRKSEYSPKDPLWVSGVHGGFDPELQRWRDPSGRYATRAAVLNSIEGDLQALGGVARWMPDRVSRAAEKLENFVAGGFSPFTYADIKRKPGSTPFPIPGNILASYRLAEFYYGSEGDVAAALETPIQVSMRDLDIRCPDTGVKREIEAMYDVDGLDMFELLKSMWLSMAVYGIAHPYEARQGDKLRGVILLPPRYTRVGRELSGDGMIPVNDQPAWTQEALRSTLPAAMYESMVRPGEEVFPLGILDLPMDSVHSVRALDQAWILYPKPFLRGAYRALSTRIVYEEMRRAVYEGFRNQLWLFLLGDAEHKPSPQMMTKLKSDVDGMSGERTGSLAWWGALKVDVKSPNTDSLMSSEEWWTLSLDIFRRLGINMRAATGNSFPRQGGEGQSFELDVDLMLEKFEYMRRMLEHWERGFRLRYAKTMGEAWVKAARDTKVVFSANALELRGAIRDRLVPLFEKGPLSVHSFLTQAGQSFATEHANKRSELGDRELWAPPETFRQGVVSEGGISRTSDSGGRQGRPVSKPENSLRASDDETEEKKRAYLILLLAAFHELAATDPDGFIERLKSINASQLAEFSDLGYRRAKGMQGAVPEPWASAASNFVNSFADRFGEDLKSGGGSMDYARRAAKYGEEGYRTAVLQGVQAAMAERHATHWRRVLHPELSKSGPCPLCVEDSQIVHAIDEPFLALHPNEVCSMEPLTLEFSGGQEGLARFGVPGVTENELTQILREAGIESQHNVRRVTGA